MAQTLLSQVPFNAYPWQANHPYAPGAVVTPTSAPNTTAVNITNADFAANITGWTASGSYSWDGTVGQPVVGSAKLAASAGANQTFVSSTQLAVVPGQAITLTCLIGNSSLPTGSGATGFARLVWYDASHAQISTSDGPTVDGGKFIIDPNPGWQPASVTGTAPANAAFVAAAAVLSNVTASPLWLDSFTWNYSSPTPVTSQNTPPQYFTNISAGTSSIVSGNAEPDWTNGGTNTGNVTDAGITWARGTQSIIYWATVPLCLSSGSEPSPWPLGIGAVISDGTGASKFRWQAQAPTVQDVNCPQSKYVCSASSKIFAGDTDILKFSATTNPLDWTTTADAGFLPTGLQNYGSNPITGVGLYRTNIAVFNSEGCQIWQTDEDPANMALLTAIPVGCSYHKTIAPVNDDLFFLAAQGVRSLSNAGTTGGAMNAGDIGMPIDSLVQLGVAYCNANGTEPVACDFPSYGQYWIHFPGWNGGGQFFVTNTSYVFVYTRSRVGQVGAWSVYTFPFPTIDVFCPNGDALLIRSGDDVLQVDPTVLYDYFGDTYNSTSRQQTFNWCLEWPYIDFGQPGTSKFLGGVDVIGKQTTNVTLSIGYNQADRSLFTMPFTMPGDSVPGLGVPMALQAPSFAVRLSGVSTDAWEVEAVILYVDDAGAGV